MSARPVPIPLDDVDRALVDLLADDGRVSNRALAAEVGLGEATVAARIRRLSEHRVMAVRAVFDWEAAGYTLNFFCGIEVEGRSPLDVAADVAAQELVHTTTIVLGSFDLWVHVLAPDHATAGTLLVDVLPGIDGVRRVDPHLTLEVAAWRWRQGVLPAQPPPLAFPAPVVPIDEVAMGVVTHLLVDGRRSNREIARLLGISEGTVRARIRGLEDAGLLRIVAQTNPNATGEIRAVFFVGIEVHGSAARALAHELAALPQTLASVVTAGRFAVQLTVAGADRDELVELVSEGLRAHPAVRSTETFEAVRALRQQSHWVRLV